MPSSTSARSTRPTPRIVTCGHTASPGTVEGDRPRARLERIGRTAVCRLHHAERPGPSCAWAGPCCCEQLDPRHGPLAQRGVGDAERDVEVVRPGAPDDGLDRPGDAAADLERTEVLPVHLEAVADGEPAIARKGDGRALGRVLDLPAEQHARRSGGRPSPRCPLPSARTSARSPTAYVPRRGRLMAPLSSSASTAARVTRHSSSFQRATPPSNLTASEGSIPAAWPFSPRPHPVIHRPPTKAVARPGFRHARFARAHPMPRSLSPGRCAPRQPARGRSGRDRRLRSSPAPRPRCACCPARPSRWVRR